LDAATGQHLTDYANQYNNLRLKPYDPQKVEAFSGRLTPGLVSATCIVLTIVFLAPHAPSLHDNHLYLMTAAYKKDVSNP